jgi:hypothetical protein
LIIKKENNDLINKKDFYNINYKDFPNYVRLYRKYKIININDLNYKVININDLKKINIKKPFLDYILNYYLFKNKFPLYSRTYKIIIKDI